VPRATHAIICLEGADHFENVGKQPLQQSGKYRVNENDEKISHIPSCRAPARYWNRPKATQASVITGLVPVIHVLS
jgi:hypothetical protein